MEERADFDIHNLRDMKQHVIMLLFSPHSSLRSFCKRASSFWFIVYIVGCDGVLTAPIVLCNNCI